MILDFSQLFDTRSHNRNKLRKCDLDVIITICVHSWLKIGFQRGVTHSLLSAWESVSSALTHQSVLGQSIFSLTTGIEIALKFVDDSRLGIVASTLETGSEFKMILTTQTSAKCDTLQKEVKCLHYKHMTFLGRQWYHRKRITVGLQRITVPVTDYFRCLPLQGLRAGSLQVWGSLNNGVT